MLEISQMVEGKRGFKRNKLTEIFHSLGIKCKYLSRWKDKLVCQLSVEWKELISPSFPQMSHVIES